MAHDKELAARIVDVLSGESVKKIDFYFGAYVGGLHISGAELGKVACLIDKGHIKVFRDPNATDQIAYDASTDELTIRDQPDFTDPEFRSGMVHEAVHALVDMVKASKTRRLANEAAAYLAQALYLWHEIGDVRLRAAVTDQLKSSEARIRGLAGVYKACLALIDRCRTITSRRVVLPWQLYQPLLEALKGPDSLYRLIPWNQTTPADGIKGAPRQCAQASGHGGIGMARSREPGPAGIADSQGSFSSGSSREARPLGIA